jgi:hypothetical protein
LPPYRMNDLAVFKVDDRNDLHTEKNV